MRHGLPRPSYNVAIARKKAVEIYRWCFVQLTFAGCLRPTVCVRVCVCVCNLSIVGIVCSSLCVFPLVFIVCSFDVAVKTKQRKLRETKI